MRTFTLLASLMAMPLTLSACSGEEGTDPPRVVVTTAWEGMYAAAAGAVDITVIVPPGTPNPPVFEPSPEQLATATGADFLLYSQAERFAQQARDAAGSEADAITIKTDNTAANVIAEVTRLGALFGTTDTALAWVEEFEAAVAGFQSEIDSQIGADEPVVVAQFHTTWLASMISSRIATFGPETPTERTLGLLAALEPSIVLNESGTTTAPVLPDSSAPQVAVLNHPDEGLDLIALYRQNIDFVLGALRGPASADIDGAQGDSR
ncbi:hypothetical protein O1R50_23005 [Glycomyces luteolus]|jgi:zinc transport system substrate-binding protein|uniref:Zinc transport system substrate-binding protein n=2 Tax=Glycomyces TaxID=58113 RepID=A0A9X3PP99_9ACTN|nr:MULTISPECIES: hypothetical protein [Glycomyces]MDA1362510.1 hypothetical protein [Glycomyces luteolus]MDN3239153.1 hypothetical protein [Glycomyces tritici]